MPGPVIHMNVIKGLKNHLRFNNNLSLLLYHITLPSSLNRCANKILTQLEIQAKAELYYGGAENGTLEQNVERRSILQKTSVRIDMTVFVARINQNFLSDVFRAVSTPTPTTAGAS